MIAMECIHRMYPQDVSIVIQLAQLAAGPAGSSPQQGFDAVVEGILQGRNACGKRRNRRRIRNATKMVGPTRTEKKQAGISRVF